MLNINVDIFQSLGAKFYGFDVTSDVLNHAPAAWIDTHQGSFARVAVSCLSSKTTTDEGSPYDRNSDRADRYGGHANPSIPAAPARGDCAPAGLREWRIPLRDQAEPPQL